MDEVDQIVVSLESESLLAPTSACAVDVSERRLLLSISHLLPAASSDGIATLAIQAGQKVLFVRVSIARAVVAVIVVGALLLLLSPRIYDYAVHSSFFSSPLFRPSSSLFLPTSTAVAGNSTHDIIASLVSSPPLAWPLALPRLNPASYECTKERLCPAAYDMLYTVDPFYYAMPDSANSSVDSTNVDTNTLASTALRVSPISPPGWQRDKSVPFTSTTASLSDYPAALFDELQGAGAEKDRTPCSVEQSRAQLLVLCQGNVTAADAWWAAALSARQVLESAPASTPAALFVEGRTDTDALYALRLLMLLDNAVQRLPASWTIHMFVQPRLISQLSHSPLFYAYTHLSRKFLLHPIPAALHFDRVTYQHFLLFPLLWHSLHPATHVVLFEADTGFCDSPDYDITYFLNWDFCGAPWYTICNEPSDRSMTACVGNTGLSVWNRPLIANVSADVLLNGTINVDLALRDAFKFKRGNAGSVSVCPSPVGRLLSVETGYDGTYTPFGYHKPYFQWFDPGMEHKFYRECPIFTAIKNATVEAAVTQR